jgi:deazaflavin-dependent oxidoreductase (nitroreductase family)
MALPRGLARFNRVVTNRITGPFAGHLPGFAIVEHVGRKSGTHYHNTVNAFRRGEGFLLVLTYGSNTDWVRNVMAAGGARLKYRGHDVDVTHPRLRAGAEATALYPTALKPLLRLLNVDEAMELDRSTEPGS